MTTPTVLDVSVVICAYTEARWNDLLAALESVQQQTRPAREIIVVVDHNPGLLQRVRAEIPGVVALENRGPRGLSSARNSGVANAKGAIIAFLDDDAVAAPDWLIQLGAGYADPLVLGVGGEIAPAWVGHRPGWFPEEFGWVVGCTYQGMPTSTMPVRNLIGANMSFRREVFETIGGFREGIGRVGTTPVGCEETELCIQVHRAWPDKVLLYEPRARVSHRVPYSRARWSYFRARCYGEGLSKAAISRHVGSEAGLASERAYALQTLPCGVVGGLVDTFRRRDPKGLVRAGAIVAGLALTTMGYLAGITSGWISARNPQETRARLAWRTRLSESRSRRHSTCHVINEGPIVKNPVSSPPL